MESYPPPEEIAQIEFEEIAENSEDTLYVDDHDDPVLKERNVGYGSGIFRFDINPRPLLEATKDIEGHYSNHGFYVAYHDEEYEEEAVDVADTISETHDFDVQVIEFR